MPAAALPIILDEKLKKVQRSLLAELDFTTTWANRRRPATQLALIFSTPPSPLLPLLLPRYDLVWPMSVTRKGGRGGRGRAITFHSHRNLQGVRIRAEPRNQNLRGT